MFNKIYEFISKLLKQNYKMIIFLVCFYIVASYPVPYYIFTSGGISDLGDRFEVEGGSIQKGSYNLSYVTELEGNVITYLASYFVPSWDLVEVSLYQVNSNESVEELAIRDKISLEIANQTAVMLAYEKAGKEVTINKTNYYIAYTMDYLESTKKIRVGDLISKIDGNEITDFEYFSNYISSKNEGDKIELELIRNDEVFTTTITVKEQDGVKLAGIALFVVYDYEVSPPIKFKFGKNESGASAGLMTTLAIYDTLVEDDLTNGMKIAGTGTIDSAGNVGEIGGVKYKLKGAESSDADIFFVPYGENYDECLKLKKEKKYDIEIVPISTLDDAINYLESKKI